MAHNKKQIESSYVEEVGQTFFQKFMQLPKEKRQEKLSYVVGNTRPLKYIFAISQMDIPDLAYMWGIISSEEAEELQSIKALMDYENFDDALNMIHVDDLDDEQHDLYCQILEAMNNGQMDFDMPEQLNKLGFSDEIVAKSDLSYDKVFRELMTNEKYYVDADGKPNDMYQKILVRFKPEYLKKLTEFKNAVDLISDRRFDESEINLSDETMLPQMQRKPDESIVSYELDVIIGILNYFVNRDIDSPALIKSIIYWEKIAQGNFRRIVREMGELPGHRKFPDIKDKLALMSQAFDSFFPTAKEQDSVICRDLLLKYVRESIQENIRNGKCCFAALEWFDTQIDRPIKQKELSPEQKLYEEKIQSRTKAILCLGQSVRKALESAHSSSSNNINTQNNQIDTKTDSGSKPLNEWSEVQKTMAELDALKGKYLADDERNRIGANRAVFSFMRDYELLYMMGVLNQDEYHLCMCYTDEYIQRGKTSAIQECTIVDIFEKLLEKPNTPTLPLKKEYLDVMEQIRLASLLHQDLYTDNTPDRMNLLLPSPFENDYMSADSELRQEGLFLEDMILLSRHIEGQKRANIYVIQLVNSYWEESVRQLTQLPEYKGRPKVLKQIQDNMIFFEVDPNMNQEFHQKQYNFKMRRPLYQHFISQLHHELCEKYDFDFKKRTQVLNAFGEYKEPFEKRLKITMDEQLKLYFGAAAKVKEWN